MTGSSAEVDDRVDEIGAAGKAFNVALWRAMAAGRDDIRVDGHGGLALVAAPSFPGHDLNRATGYRERPDQLARIVDWFRANGTVGWIAAREPPWADAAPEHPMTIVAAAPDRIAAVADRSGNRLPEGAVASEIGPDRAGTFAEVLIAGSGIDPGRAPLWRAAIARLIGQPGQHFVLVEMDRRPIGVANVFVRGRVGMLGLMAVLHDQRGRGLQRSLIALRTAIAAADGATVVAAGALAGSVSGRNLAAVGLEPIRAVALYRCDPAERNEGQLRRPPRHRERTVGPRASG